MTSEFGTSADHRHVTGMRDAGNGAASSAEAPSSRNISPDVLAASKSTRTPADVLAKRGVSPTPACPCPFCGIDPPNATMNRYGYFVVGCDNDDCPAQPQVSDKTLTGVWARWNTRPQTTARKQEIAG